MDPTRYKSFKKVLLFYSGGLDTSFLLKWFVEEVGSEVITASFDLGGDAIEVGTIEKRAKQLGATRFTLLDAKEQFVEEFCWRAVKANALFEGAHPLSSSLSRPLMSRLGVELARKYGCHAIVHGSNGWQNNSARFDTSMRVLADDIEVLEPIMENDVSRDFEYEYLKKRHLTIDKGEDNLLSSDNNLWGREVEDGVLEFPDREPEESIYRITSSPEAAPNKPEYVEIDFSHGVPVALNGRPQKPLAIVERLNAVGGKHGIGRYDAMEDKVIGFKMREIHESPAATLLILAHNDLETTVLPRKSLTVKNVVDLEWVELVCYGLWYHPLREELEALIDRCNRRITGSVRLKLYKGTARVVGRKSPHGLYQHNLQARLKRIYRRSPHPDRNFYDYYSYESKIAELTER